MVKKLLLLLALVVSGFGIAQIYSQNTNPTSVRAYGNLTVDFHSTLPGNTIFDINNFLPGESINKNVDVKNDGNTTEVFVKGIKKSGNSYPKLENALDIKISQGSTTVYSKKLKNFLEGDKVSLGTVNKNRTRTYNFKVAFQTSAGNEYQGKSVKFDLDFSNSGDVKGDHDESGDNDHKKDFRDHLKDFGDKCKSAAQGFFKFRK